MGGKGATTLRHEGNTVHHYRQTLSDPKVTTAADEDQCVDVPIFKELPSQEKGEKILRG